MCNLMTKDGRKSSFVRSYRQNSLCKRWTSMARTVKTKIWPPGMTNAFGTFSSMTCTFQSTPSIPVTGPSLRTTRSQSLVYGWFGGRSLPWNCCIVCSYTCISTPNWVVWPFCPRTLPWIVTWKWTFFDQFLLLFRDVSRRRSVLRRRHRWWEGAGRLLIDSKRTESLPWRIDRRDHWIVHIDIAERKDGSNGKNGIAWLMGERSVSGRGTGEIAGRRSLSWWYWSAEFDEISDDWSSSPWIMLSISRLPISLMPVILTYSLFILPNQTQMFAGFPTNLVSRHSLLLSTLLLSTSPSYNQMPNHVRNIRFYDLRLY